MATNDILQNASLYNDPTLLHCVEADDADLLIDDLLTVRGESLEDSLMKHLDKERDQ